MLIADAVISVVLWKNDILEANRIVAPVLGIVGWFMFVQSRSDRYNQNSQCARCGDSVIDKDTVLIKSFKAYDPVYMYCMRCGPIVSVERGLLLFGGPLALLAGFLAISAVLNPDSGILFLPVSVVCWIIAALLVRRTAPMEGQRGKTIYASWLAVSAGLALMTVLAGLLIALPRFL